MAEGNGNPNGAGGDDYRTFSGAGFGTLMVQLATGPKETPKVASSRAYLRAGLPAVYQEGDFGMRFIGALETLLDPIVAVLDALPAHFSADHAPRDVLDLLSAWLGVDLFLRGNRTLTLTAAGTTYLPQVRAALEMIVGASNAVPGRKPTGRLAVSVSPTFGVRWLLPRLVRFSDRHPDIEVSVDTNHRLVEFPRDGIDVEHPCGIHPADLCLPGHLPVA